MKNIPILLVFILISVTCIKAQTNDKTIAKIGNISISEKEFTARYELTPLPGLNSKNMGAALKEQFIYSLIAEKLFALDAMNSRLGTNEIVKFSLNTFEKMFVRDALYKEVITNKAKFKADSLLTEYIRSASEFRCIYIFSKEEPEANRIYNLLEKGVPFDSLYTELNGGLNDTLQIKIGDLDEDKEAVILKIRERSYSRPLLMNEGLFAGNAGWYIFKVVKRNNPVLTKASGWEQDFKNLKKVAQERVEAVIYKKFMGDFFSKKKIRADGILLKSVAEKISSLFEKKSKSRKSEDDKIFLDVAGILEIGAEFGKDSLNLTFIYLDKDIITLKDFLNHFRFESFSSTKYDFRTIVSLLNSKNKKFIEEELLAKEGYKRGLQNSPAVKESYNMWRDNYLFQVAKLNVQDSASVTDADVIKEYSKSAGGYTKPAEVKIIQILTDSLEIAETILNELRNNADMHQLAKKYSKQILTRDNGGETGFFPVTSYGEIGRIASGMQIGEIYGPLKTDDGYAIFKLIDRREEQKIPGASFESVKNDLRENLERNKAYNSVINRTVILANKYGITINKNLIAKVSPSNITALIFRNLGFGGRITAVPFITPDNAWVKQWQENTSNIQ